MKRYSFVLTLLCIALPVFAADEPAWEPEPQVRAAMIANAAEPDRVQLLEDIRRVYGAASAKRDCPVPC